LTSAHTPNGEDVTCTCESGKRRGEGRGGGGENNLHMKAERRERCDVLVLGFECRRFGVGFGVHRRCGGRRSRSRRRGRSRGGASGSRGRGSRSSEGSSRRSSRSRFGLRCFSALCGELDRRRQSHEPRSQVTCAGRRRRGGMHLHTEGSGSHTVSPNPFHTKPSRSGIL
jgi:hypothetical protein